MVTLAAKVRTSPLYLPLIQQILWYILQHAYLPARRHFSKSLPLGSTAKTEEEKHHRIYKMILLFLFKMTMTTKFEIHP
jgi:hypothetical protein